MKHLKQIIARIISIFAPSENKTTTYQKIAGYSFSDKQELKRFIKTPIKNNSVLLIETNRCHGEVISAYWKYLIAAGFNTDLLIHNYLYKEPHFSRHDTSDINIFHCDTTGMHNILQSEKAHKYKHIIIMTPMNYTFETQPVLKLFPELKKFKNLHLICHNTPDIETYYSDFEKSHIFGLGRRLKDFPCTNPHLFGDTEKNTKKHTPTTFITVGGINPQRKNHTILIESIKKLSEKNYNFKVIIVGGGKKIKNIPNNIKKHIILTGRQIGEKMFQYMEQSDFFLTLWDTKNNSHYKTNTVSGSPQLIYGFNKIPILERSFADFYDFDEENSILYNGDNLSSAMETAIQMNDQEYKNKFEALKATSSDIYNESLQNIINALK